LNAELGAGERQSFNSFIHFICSSNNKTTYKIK